MSHTLYIVISSLKRSLWNSDRPWWRFILNVYIIMKQLQRKKNKLIIDLNQKQIRLQYVFFIVWFVSKLQTQRYNLFNLRNNLWNWSFLETSSPVHHITPSQFPLFMSLFIITIHGRVALEWGKIHSTVQLINICYKYVESFKLYYYNAILQQQKTCSDW